MRRALRKPLLCGIVIATWAAGCYVGETESEKARRRGSVTAESTTFVPVEAGDQPPLPPNAGPGTNNPKPGDDDDDDPQPQPDASTPPQDSGGSTPTDAATD